MLYGDLLELRINPRFGDPEYPAAAGCFHTLDMLNMSTFAWEESDADPASIESVGT
jgi:hypothetical protein